MTSSRTSPLFQIGQSYVLEACPMATAETVRSFDRIIDGCISGSLDWTAAIQVSIELIASAHPIKKLQTILTLSPEPLPALTRPGRKKNDLWLDVEDARLIAGVHRFGAHSWGSVAAFVGNRRTKAQCYQRWSRCLDPSISRTPWTAPEDAKLRALVRAVGQKSWKRVAEGFGIRSDAQCRYRFYQLANARCREGARVERPRTALPPIDCLIARMKQTPRPESSSTDPEISWALQLTPAHSPSPI
jgi:hypothetical protein